MSLIMNLLHQAIQLITWLAWDLHMAVIELLISPLWLAWNVAWFVFSHGWSLAIAVAAATAIAVIIRHRRGSSSSSSATDKVPPAVILSEIFKVIQVHPRNGWSLTAVVQSLRVFSRFFPVLSHPSGSPVLATCSTSLLDMPPKRALQLATSTSDLLCWIPGATGMVQTLRKPQNGYSKTAHSDGDVIRFTVKWEHIKPHPPSLWKQRMKMVVYRWLERYLACIVGAVSPPADFVSETMERTWQVHDDKVCSLLCVPQQPSSSLPYHWLLVMFISVPKQKDKSVAAVFALPKGDLDVAVHHCVLQLCALREHAVMRELRMYSISPPSSRNHIVSSRRRSPSVEPPTVPPFPPAESTTGKQSDQSDIPPQVPPPPTVSYESTLSESDQRYLAQARHCARQLVEVARATEQDGWAPVGTIKNVSILKKIPKRGDPPVNCVKGSTYVDVPPDFALRLLMDTTYANELDELLKDLHEVHEVNSSIHILHLHYKGIWPTSPRDFAVLDVAGRMDELTNVHAALSIIDPRVPEEKGYVRGDVLAGGYVIDVCPGEPERSHITYITQVDLKGNVPSFVVNKMVETQPMCAAKMRQIAEREYAKATSNPHLMRELEEKLPIHYIIPENAPPTFHTPAGDHPPATSEPQVNTHALHQNHDSDINSAASLPVDSVRRDADDSPHPSSSHDSPTQHIPFSSSSSSSFTPNSAQETFHTDENTTVTENDGATAEDVFESSSRDSLPISPLLNKLPRYSTTESNSSREEARRPSSASNFAFAEASLEYPRRENQIDFRTLGNQAAAQLLEEMFHIDGLKIHDPNTYTDQSNNWRFDGMDKDVVVLKRKTPDSPFYSFIGKGIIGLPPQEVFNTVRNPNQRFIFDNMLKELHIVKQIEEGLYVLHLHHETTQCFLKQSRDFCLLVSERSEPNKKLLVGTSVDISECPPQPNITRGKIMSSGWVIEPYRMKGKLCTEVTYMVQIDIGGLPATLVNFISRRQPLAVAYLRDYLESTTVSSYQPTDNGKEEEEEVQWDPVLFRK